MPDQAKRRARRNQHALEVEESQAGLRKSIAETERLLDESDVMLKRHRQECDDDDSADSRSN